MSIFLLFLSFFLFLSLCVCLCLPLWLTDANTPKKCRALFGLDQLSLWCKPCRYNCCSSNGRKTSTMSSFFSLMICSDIPLKTFFHRCAKTWKNFSCLLLSSLRGASCSKFPHSSFSSFNLVQAPVAENGFLNKISQIYLEEISRGKITAS